MDGVAKLSTYYTELLQERTPRGNMSKADFVELEDDLDAFWHRNSTSVIRELASERSLKTLYYGPTLPSNPLPYVRMTAFYSHRILFDDPSSSVLPSTAPAFNQKIRNIVIHHIVADLRMIKPYIEEGIVAFIPPLYAHNSRLHKKLWQVANKDFDNALATNIDPLRSFPVFKFKDRDLMRFIATFYLSDPTRARLVFDLVRKGVKSGRLPKVSFNKFMLVYGAVMYLKKFVPDLFWIVNNSLAQSAIIKCIPSTDAIAFSNTMKVKLENSQKDRNDRLGESSSIDSTIVDVLPHLDLWFLRDVSDERILWMRRDTAEFHYLRENLRNVFRRIQDAKPSLREVSQLATEAKVVIEKDLRRLEEKRKLAKSLYGVSAVQGTIAASTLLLGLTPVDILLSSSTIIGSLISSALGYKLSKQGSERNSFYLFWTEAKKRKGVQRRSVSRD